MQILKLSINNVANASLKNRDVPDTNKLIFNKN